MKQDLKLLLSNETNEWYTPPDIIELARKVLGYINIDPASNATAQEWIKAATYYTKEDDSLTYKWYGKAWLNPPYGRTNGRTGQFNQKVWSEKLIEEYEAGRVEEAILLVKAALGYNWFDDLRKHYPVCYMYGLMRFLNEEGKPAGKSKWSSAFFYFGQNYHKFLLHFSEIGDVHLPQYEQNKSFYSSMRSRDV